MTNFYTENDEILLKHFKRPKPISIHHVYRLKAQYCENFTYPQNDLYIQCNLNQNPLENICIIDKLILQFTRKHKRTRMPKTILKVTIGGLTLLSIKTQ